MGLYLIILVNVRDCNEKRYKFINFIVEEIQNGTFAFDFLDVWYFLQYALKFQKYKTIII